MRLTEATSNDHALLVGAKSTSPQTSGGVASQFASVLSATRQSSNRLMDLMKAQSQTRRDVAEQQERRAADRVEESQSEAGRRRQADRPSRSEQLRSMARERAKSAEPAKEPPDRSEEDVEQAVENSPAAGHSPEQRPAVSPTNATVTSTPEPVPQSGSVPPQAQAQGGGPEAPSAGAAPVAARVPRGDPPAAPPVAPPEAIAGSAQAIKAVSPAGTRAQAESTASAKPVEAGAPAATTPRTGKADGEFKNLLQQLSRPRVGESTVSASSLTKAKAAVGRTDKPLDMDSAETVPELARVVRSRIGPRQSSMTMTLSPAELGRLRVDVRMHDAALTVRFQTETTAGHDAIKAKLDELRGALEQQGVQIDRIEVEHAPPAHPVSREGQGSHEQPPPHGGQWQTPAGDGGSAGQARQSFDQPRHAAGDSSPAEHETGASDQLPDMSVASNWLRPGVDLVA